MARISCNSGHETVEYGSDRVKEAGRLSATTCPACDVIAELDMAEDTIDGLEQEIARLIDLVTDLGGEA